MRAPSETGDPVDEIGAQARFAPIRHAASSTTLAQGDASCEHWLSRGDVVGVLGDVPVVVEEVHGHFTRHVQAISAARRASRARDGAPVVVLERHERSGADVYAAVSARFQGTPPPYTHALRSRIARTRVRVSDIVFGDVSMVVPAMRSPSPWLYLLE